MDIQAMLCDHAEVSGGKLFINGAGVALIGTAATAPPFGANVALALLITIPWTATNQQHRLTIELISEGANTPDRIPLNDTVGPGQAPEDEGIILALFNAGRAPHMVIGEDTLMPLALPLALPLPQLGSYFFDIQLDGTTMKRVSFRLISQSSQPG